ncbi:MAG: CotH kinase family protein [Butyrivibrio sp.]|nr:CotH kinase family protein [Butyrivibrio sp.]
MRINKLPIIKLVLLLTALFLTVLIVRDELDQKGVSDVDFMYVTAGGQRINIFENSGEYYLFLPDFFEEEDLTYSPEARSHEIKILSSSHIPSVFVTTNSGSLEKVYADKEYKESGKISVMEDGGDRADVMGLEYIKGRGNYSWNNWDKKSFKIKLSKSASILGLGTGEEYALIANASDATLIRNHIARGMEIAVGIPFSRVGCFVDLYVNGDYMGNYYLCDYIDIGKDKIDITNLEEIQKRNLSRINISRIPLYETPMVKGYNLPDVVDDITGGYLLEREFVDRYLLEYPEMKSGFITDEKDYFTVKSPKYCSAREIEYISDVFSRAEEAILTGGGYRDYIDEESYANRYLVEETLKNYDGGVSSTYYYKDSDLVDSHIYAGPGWDFDMSLGNYLDWMEYYGEDATGITGLYLSEHSSVIFRELMKYDDFSALVRRNYRTYCRPYLEELLSKEIDTCRDTLKKSAAMDRIRWQNMYNEKGYFAGDEAEYNRLKDFIRERMEFLDKEWGN